MTAPIRPEHYDAARAWIIQTEAAGTKMPAWWHEHPLAQLLADTEAAKDAEIARLSAEYAAAVRALRACDSACLNESASAVLSTERALAVLKQGETTDV